MVVSLVFGTACSGSIIEPPWADPAVSKTEDLAEAVALRMAPDKHPAQVLITAMRAAGYQQDTLGEVQGELSELKT